MFGFSAQLRTFWFRRYEIGKGWSCIIYGAHTLSQTLATETTMATVTIEASSKSSLSNVRRNPWSLVIIHKVRKSMQLNISKYACFIHYQCFEKPCKIYIYKLHKTNKHSGCLGHFPWHFTLSFTQLAALKKKALLVLLVSLPLHSANFCVFGF